jgi:hypothetical protein
MLRKWMTFVLVMMVFLVGCDGTSKKETEKHCLVGTWMLTTEEAFARAVLPPGSFDPKTLNFEESQGIVSYVFDGSLVSVQVIQWAARFGVRLDTGLMALDLQISGAGGAEYSLEGDILKIGRIKTEKSAIGYTAMLDGEEMVNTMKVEDFAPLFVTPYTSARYVCSEDTLNLEILNLPGAQPITFVRVKPKGTPQP